MRKQFGDHQIITNIYLQGRNDLVATKFLPILILKDISI
jgi:hypothetical protein